MKIETRRDFSSRALGRSHPRRGCVRDDASTVGPFPEKESGKTRLAVEVLGLVVRAPPPVANISEAALFRLVESEPLTVLHDEVDAVFGSKARDREDLGR